MSKCILVSWVRHGADYLAKCVFRIIDTGQEFETYLPYDEARLYENKEIELKGFDLVRSSVEASIEVKGEGDDR